MKFNINQTKQFHGSALPNRVKFKTRRDSYHHICILSERKKNCSLVWSSLYCLEANLHLKPIIASNKDKGIKQLFCMGGWSSNDKDFITIFSFFFFNESSKRKRIKTHFYFNSLYFDFRFFCFTFLFLWFFQFFEFQKNFEKKYNKSKKGHIWRKEEKREFLCGQGWKLWMAPRYFLKRNF